MVYLVRNETEPCDYDLKLNGRVDKGMGPRNKVDGRHTSYSVQYE